MPKYYYLALVGPWQILYQSNIHQGEWWWSSIFRRRR